MASKLVKNATAPTPPATAAMTVTTAAWKRRSHVSAAWTLGSAMLGGRCGWGVAGIVGLLWGLAAGEEGGGLAVGIGCHSLGQRPVGARSPTTIAAMARPRPAMATVPTMAATVASTVATSATMATTVPAVMPAMVSTRVMAVAGCIRPSVSRASTDAGTRVGSAWWT